MEWDLGQGAETATPKVTGKLIIGSTELAVKAAASGLGIAYADAREAAPFVEKGELVRIMEEWTPPFDSEALYYPSSRLPSAAFKAFVAFIRSKSKR